MTRYLRDNQILPSISSALMTNKHMELDMRIYSFRQMKSLCIIHSYSSWSISPLNFCHVYKNVSCKIHVNIENHQFKNIFINSFFQILSGAILSGKGISSCLYFQEREDLFYVKDRCNLHDTLENSRDS